MALNLNDPTPIRLRDDDQADETPAGAGVISAVTEAQLLEISGRLGAAKLAILRGLEQTSTPAMRRQMRLAFGNIDEAIRLSQGVLSESRRL